MPPSEKAKIVLEAKDKASKDMKKVRREFGKLVGAIAAGNIAANIADKALGSLTKGMGQLATATKVAARIQVLNRVVNLTGQSAGWSAIQLEDNKNAIIKLGIAEQEALGIQQRFIQVQLDIADAVKIARVAQDLAVIAGTNSSETALQLTNALVKQRPILLKQFGIIADLNDIYGAQAHALGKTIDALTKTEKRQAFLNEILEQAKTVAGAYESAMKDVGKRMTSLPRHVQAAQNAIGTLFLPVMGAAVDGATDLLKTIKILGDSLNTSLPKAIKTSAAALREFAGTKEAITELLDEYFKLTENTSRSEAEHKKLDTTIQALGRMLPGAITQWDEYGNAVEISADAIERLVTQQENVVKAKFLHNVGRLRTEFNELGKVDLDALTDKMAELAKESIRLAKIPAGDRILEINPHKFVDPLRDVNNELGRLKTLLTNTSEGLDEIVAQGSTAYPNLKEGTEEYHNALTFLKEELFNAVLAHQALFAASQDNQAKDKEVLTANQDNVLALSEYVTGLEVVDGKLQLIKEKFLDVADALPDTESALYQTPIGYGKRWKLTSEEIIETVDEYSTYTVTESGKVMKSVVADIKRQGQEHDKYRNLIIKNVDVARDKNMEAAQAMGAMAVNAAGTMTRAFLQGRKDMGEIFEGMAQDFLAFFVEQALIALLDVFVPGLGKILGGIFDTPANDRMAMEQGRHFSQWFTRGALGELQAFPTTFAGMAAGNLAGGGASPLLPGGAGGGAGGINITFNNPIMTQDFITDDVVDIIEKTSRDGVASIVLDDTNLTGKDDGAIL